MYISYLLYQTEHTKTAQQQREADFGSQPLGGISPLLLVLEERRARLRITGRAPRFGLQGCAFGGA